MTPSFKEQTGILVTTSSRWTLSPQDLHLHYVCYLPISRLYLLLPNLLCPLYIPRSPILFLGAPFHLLKYNHGNEHGPELCLHHWRKAIDFYEQSDVSAFIHVI